MKRKMRAWLGEHWPDVLFGTAIIILMLLVFRIFPDNRTVEEWSSFSGIIGDSIGLLTAFFSFCAWRAARKIERNTKKYVPNVDSDSGMEAVFVVGIGSTAKMDVMYPDVARFLDEENRGKAKYSMRQQDLLDFLQKNYLSFHIGRSGQPGTYDKTDSNAFNFAAMHDKKVYFLSCESDIPADKSELTRYMQTFHDSFEFAAKSFAGIRKIHMFYQGPGSLSFMIGERLANQKTLALYQYDRVTKRYVYLGDI